MVGEGKFAILWWLGYVSYVVYHIWPLLIMNDKCRVVGNIIQSELPVTIYESVSPSLSLSFCQNMSTRG